MFTLNKYIILVVIFLLLTAGFCTEVGYAPDYIRVYNNTSDTIYVAYYWDANNNKPTSVKELFKESGHENTGTPFVKLAPESFHEYGVRYSFLEEKQPDILFFINEYETMNGYSRDELINLNILDKCYEVPYIDIVGMEYTFKYDGKPNKYLMQ